jgi:thiol-disulfide isomerase/thioredoxin
MLNLIDIEKGKNRRNNMSNKYWITLVFVVVIIGGLGYGYFSKLDAEENNTKTAKTIEQKEKKKNEKKYPLAPDFALQDLDGKTVQLSDFKGNVIIIDFWATWCGPCRRGIPDFVELQNEYGEDNLTILGVNVDQGDLSIVPKFAESYKINYPVLYSNMDIIRKYGPINSIPLAFIVDREGYVRDYIVGLRPKTYFKQRIESLL